MARLSSAKPRLGSLSPRLGVHAAPGSVEQRARRADVPNNTARWQRLRLTVLRKTAVDIRTLPNFEELMRLIDRDHDTPLFKREPFHWPVCAKTGVMLIGKAPAPNSPVADHITPHRGDLGLFWDEQNLQAVSKEYHDRVKQRFEKRGALSQPAPKPTQRGGGAVKSQTGPKP